MKKMIALLACSTVLLGACVDSASMSASAPSQFISEVPEGVLSIAAGGQDLTALNVDPVDGCYVYRHVGPVETTMLPLRASNGRPICTRADS